MSNNIDPNSTDDNNENQPTSQGFDAKQMLKAELKKAAKNTVKKSLFLNPVSLGIMGVILLIIVGLICGAFAILISFTSISQDMDGGGTYISDQNMSALAQQDITPEQLSILMEAQAKYKIPWSVLAAISKYRTNLGADCINYGTESSDNFLFQCVQKNDQGVITAVGPYALSAMWWGRSPVLLATPATIKSNSGFGVNQYDLDTTADPADFRDATFAVARYLKLKKFDSDPRAAVKMLVGTEAATSAIFNFVDMYAPPIEEGLLDNHELVWPVPDSHTITSDFGYRTDPFTKKKKFHTGIDIGRPDRSKEYTEVAIANATVSFAGFAKKGSGFGGYGNMVALDYGNGVYSLYGHMKTLPFVKTGDTVTAGQALGIMGTTGSSTGIHLHFTMWVGSTYKATKDENSLLHPLCVFKLVKSLAPASSPSSAEMQAWQSAKTEFETTHPGQTYPLAAPSSGPKVSWTQAVRDAGVKNLSNCPH